MPYSANLYGIRSKRGVVMAGLWFMSDISRFVSKAGFVNVTRPKGHKAFFRNGKRVYTFAYIVSGCMRYDISGQKQVTAIAGTLLFIPKAVEYKAEYLEDESTVKVLTFDFTADPTDQLFQRPFNITSHRIKEVFDTIDHQNGINSMYLVSRLYKLFWLLGEMNVSTDKRFQRLFSAIQHIEQNYSDNVKISEYAKMSGMSESNFRKQFKQCTGMSPIDYRNSVRLNIANKLIQSKEYTVSEAAYFVGFNNMSFFYEAYKRQFGIGKIKE